VKLWNDLRGWAGANAAALRLCFRMTVAGLLAYVLAEFFALPQGYWAVFSAIIVMQASVGGSVKATIDRVIGTIGGAVAGGAVGYLVPHHSVFSLGVALVIALAPLTLVAALWPNYRIAPLTAVIVLLTPGAQQLGPVDSAIFRIVEITLGSFVGLGVSLVLLPARAHGLVISTAARALSLLADLLGDWLAVLAGGRDRTRITNLQDDIRAAMARLEIVAGNRRGMESATPGRMPALQIYKLPEPKKNRGSLACVGPGLWKCSSVDLLAHRPRTWIGGGFLAQIIPMRAPTSMVKRSRIVWTTSVSKPLLRKISV
jgi:uncharacterized membrane protein YccC